jgi:hypothetical protein
MGSGQACGLALTSSFVQRLDMTMHSVFCIMSPLAAPDVTRGQNTEYIVKKEVPQVWGRVVGVYATACSWLKLPPTLRM